MAGNSERTSIADDWEEISSVSPARSIPSTPSTHSSDDDGSLIELSPPYESPQLSPTTAPESAVAAPDGPTDGSSSNASSSVTSLIELPASAAIVPPPADTISLDTSVDFPDRTLEARGPRGDGTGDSDTQAQTDSDTLPSFPSNIPEPENSPVLYHAALVDMANTINEALEHRWDIPGPNLFVFFEAVDTLKALSLQAQELDPILDAYARHWKAHGSGMAAGEMPLNASSLDWMRAVKDRVIHLDADLRSAWPGHIEPRRVTPEEAERLIRMSDPGRHLEPLNELRRTMDEFLPMLKTDFSEFRTSFMSFPVYREEATFPHSGRREPPHPVVVRIRRELYDLKDQVQAVMVLMDGFYATDPPPPFPDIPAMLKSLNIVSNAISTCLTNNNSDWIQSTVDPNLPRTLSFPDFVALDPDVLHDVGTHFRNFCDEMGAGTISEVGQNVTLEMIRNHQIVSIVERRLLHELRSVTEFLESLLMPRGETDAI